MHWLTQAIAMEKYQWFNWDPEQLSTIKDYSIHVAVPIHLDLILQRLR